MMHSLGKIPAVLPLDEESALFSRRRDFRGGSTALAALSICSLILLASPSKTDQRFLHSTILHNDAFVTIINISSISETVEKCFHFQTLKFEYFVTFTYFYHMFLLTNRKAGRTLGFARGAHATLKCVKKW